jgi:hypothetical protein
MKTFADYIEANWHIRVPKGNISGEWFKQNFLPMVVCCTCCQMTMASPSAWVDENGNTYCGTCAQISEN